MGESSKLHAKIIHWVCHLCQNDRYYFSSSFQGAGFDPNAVDEYYGNTPHVILARDRPAIDIICTKIMLDAGAHIYHPNKNKLSVLIILQSRLKENYSEISPLIYSVRPLKCLCANVIRQNKIPFENLLPSTLESFVLLD